MRVIDLHVEDPLSEYRYCVPVEDILVFNSYRRGMTRLYGWGWDTSRENETHNTHWATRMEYRNWQILLRDEDELLALSLIS